MKTSFARINYHKNLYLKSGSENKILLAEIFVDDIIFGGHDIFYREFPNEMKKEFEMSMFGEIKLFVGLQVYQMKGGIYITQSKYIKDILKTFRMEDSRPIGIPMTTGYKFLKNDDFSEVN